MIDSINKLTDTNQGGEDNLDMELKVFDFSHYPLPKKDKDCIQMFYNNINGLEINEAIASIVNKKKIKKQKEITGDPETYTKLESFIKQMHTWEVDISVLSESCIEWRDVIPRRVVTDISKKYDTGGTWTVSTSSCYSGSFVKPGGALVYSSGNLSGKIMERGTDPWKHGRWSYVRYQGKKGNSLMIIGGYRVGCRSNVAGASTAWYQQKVLLTEANRTEEPDEAFLTDFASWYEEIIQPQTEVLLFLDANEQWTTLSKIRQWAKKLQLANLNIDGGYHFPATYPCITNHSRDTTINYCLCTPGVLDSIAYATMAPFDLHTLGDHRGLLIDVQVSRLLQSLAEPREISVGRKLATNNPVATEKYLLGVEKGFLKQNIFERTRKLYYQWTHKKRRSGIL